MKIDLILQAGTRPNLIGKTVVVIDVLRASSTILTALTNGCREIIPVVEPEEALIKAGEVGGDRPLIGGERGGLKIPGFDLGNSPLEYTKEMVDGRRLVFCTSNGTKALKEAEKADEVLVGCFLNLSRLTSHLLTAEKEELILFCAGSGGRPSLEDTLCAGAIAQGLFQARGVSLYLSDQAKEAMISYRELAGEEIWQALARSEHGQRLSSLGFTDDLRYCGRIDTHPYLSAYQEGSLRLRA